MEYPHRATTHIKERKAVKILEDCLPDEWIVREMTERDYGIDLYIEIIGKNRMVTGDLVALQVKGTEEVLFDKNAQYRFSGIKMSTFNYWCNLPVVVFLVVVDLKNKIPYWINIKSALREYKINKQEETISFILHQGFSFDKMGLLVFQMNYLKEKRWADVAKAVLDSLALYNTLGPLYLYCKRKCQNEISSSTIQFLLLRHYENFYLMYKYLSFGKPIHLPEWYDKHLNFIKNNDLEASITFYYSTVMEMFKYFLNEYLKLIENAYQIVTVYEKDYWIKQNPYLVGQLITKPLLFNLDDWYARYFFDEYENETDDIGECFLED